MILSMHQPSYFPWLGLLDKIKRSDAHIMMDEVQLSDSAYQHRNLFLTADGRAKFLTIPLVKKGYLERSFREIEIARSDWRNDHFNFIANTYRKHPFAREVMPQLEAFYAVEYRLLADVVLASMRLSLDFFAIKTRLILQSEIEYDHCARRGDLVVALTRAAGAHCYLSGAGARAYLDESAFPSDVTVRYNDFTHPEYPQKGAGAFLPGLTCVDALFNVGPEGARALLGGD